MTLRYKLLHKSRITGPKPKFHAMCSTGSHARVVRDGDGTLTCVDCGHSAPDGGFGRALSVRDRAVALDGAPLEISEESWGMAVLTTAQVADLARLEDFAHARPARR